MARGGQSLCEQIGDYGLVDIAHDGRSQSDAQRRPKAGIDLGMGEGGSPHNGFTLRVPLALFAFLEPVLELVCRDEEREKSDENPSEFARPSSGWSPRLTKVAVAMSSTTTTA